MPQRNHIEAPFAVSRQRFRSLHHQLEMLLGNARACGLFSMAETFHPRFCMKWLKYPVPVPISSKLPFRVPQIRSISEALRPSINPRT